MHSLTNTPRDSIQISNEKDKALHCSLGFFSKEVLTSTVVFSGTDLSFPIVQWSSGKEERIDARANSTLGANSLHICSTLIAKKSTFLCDLICSVNSENIELRISDFANLEFQFFRISFFPVDI